MDAPLTSTKARAEQNLLRSLSKPRVSKNKTGYGNQFSKTSSLAETTFYSHDDQDFDDMDPQFSSSTPSSPQNSTSADPFSKTKVDLKMAKKQRRAMALREQNIEIQEVAILASDPSKEAKKHSFTKIENKLEDKRIRHDQAYKQYKQTLSEVADSIEDHYVSEADRIKSKLSSYDSSILDLFKELNQDSILETKDYSYVTNMWEQINDILASRTNEVLHFGDQLEEFEQNRSSTMAKHLRMMVDKQVQIALKLPQQIERTAEAESYELNSVIIGNRRAHAELLARMEKEDIIEKVEARKKWEARQSDWRTLRHKRGIREFHADITSDNFTNPPDRVETFRLFKQSQDSRHEHRCQLLKQLGSLDNETLSSEQVDNLRFQFKEVNNAELKGIKTLYDMIISLKHAKHDEADVRRENLRAELHNYGALHLEPDLETNAEAIDEEVAQAALEEFFRKSGGLKSSLVTVSKQLRDPNLIYQKYLHEVKRGITIILCGKDLENVLEKQGKDSMRKNMQDTLERLRKATKSEVVPILPLLKQQCVDLAVVNKIDPLLKLELSTASDQLQSLIESVVDSHTLSSGKSQTSMTESKAASRRDSRIEAGDNTINANNSATVMENINTTASGNNNAPSESNKSRRSSTIRRNTTTAGSTSAGKGWDDGPELDMLAVRQIQKHLGLLMAVCELNPSFVDCLKAIFTGLDSKEICNTCIDLATSAECTAPIKARSLEQDSLIDWVEQSLSAQSVTLHSGAERLCSFYHAIAGLVERHRVREVNIDEDEADAMFELKEDFRMADEDREGSVSHALDRLRHAADEKELESSFDYALSMLKVIESEYRVYHEKAVKSAAKHPKHVDEEHRKFCFVTCDRFGLVPPKHMFVPEDGGGEGGEATAAAAAAEPVVEAAAFAEPAAETDGLGGETNSNSHSGEPSTSSSAEEKGGEKGGEKGEGEEEKKLEDAETIAQNFHGNGDPFTLEEEAAHREAAKLEAAKLKAEEERLAAEEELKALSERKTAEDTLWTVDISAREGFSSTAARYSYGVKVPTEEMVKELLSPPEEGEAGEEDDVPKEFPVYGREARVGHVAGGEGEEEEEETSKGGGGGGDNDDESDSGGGAIVFFPPSFSLITDVAFLEMNEHERESYVTEHDRLFIPLGQEEVNCLPDEDTFGRYSKCLRETNERRKEKAGIILEAKAKRDSTPVDKDSNTCISITLLPPALTTSYISSLKDSLLSNMEVDSAARKKKMDDLNDERAEDLTEELEERLRLHWPRKGRTEVKSRQPREGELVSHRQKSARFLRQFYQRLGEQEEEFGRLVGRVEGHSDEFSTAVRALGETLKEMGSLAALQGQEMKCKNLLATFFPECEDLRDTLSTFLHTKPQKLSSTITELIRLTKTFNDGGDYDVLEVTDLKALLIEPGNKLGRAVADRSGKVDGLESYQAAAVECTKAFKVEYERCLLELSLRLGLGKKFGAPRRNAQERLRTEVTRDEYSAQNVDKLLGELEEMCEGARRMYKGSSTKSVRGGGKTGNAGNATVTFEEQEEVIKAKESSGGGEAIAEESANSTTTSAERQLPIAVQITHTMLSIRGALYRRAQYLDFLVNPISVNALHSIPPSLEESSHGVSHELEDAMVVGTFQTSIEHLQKQCREETKALFAKEGKTNLLGEGGVPDSLRERLEASWIKVLGPRDGGEILNEARVVMVDVDMNGGGNDNNNNNNHYVVQYTDGLEEKGVAAVLIRSFGSVPVRAPTPPVHLIGSRVSVHLQCHREKSRRRVRAQVERLERLIAKNPVLPNPLQLGAPSASVLDVMSRCRRDSRLVVRRAEAGFKKLLDVWDKSKAKHKNSLRPQLGSPDAVEQLEKLKRKEIQRSEEVKNAVRKFKVNLLNNETEAAKNTVKRLVSIVKCSASILDTLVLREDCYSLPGDELILPKRKSLKRLRKASASAGKSATDADADADADANANADAIEPEGEPQIPKKIDTGRQYVKRTWASLPLDEFARQMDLQVPPAAKLTKEEDEEEEEERKRKEKEEKGKGKGKGGKSGGAAVVEEEGGAAEDGVTEAQVWAKNQAEESVFESYLTTSHRCLVKTALAELEVYTHFYKEQMESIMTKYDKIYEEESIWEEMWANMCKDLTDMN